MSKTKLIISLLSFILFLIVLIVINNGTPLIDEKTASIISEIRNPFLDGIFVFFGNYLKEILIALSLIVALILYSKKKKRESFILLLSLILGYVLEQSIKFVVQRTRATTQLVTEIDYSFPSGHSIFSIILFSMIIYFFKDEIKNITAKIFFILINILLILFVGFSRIYINVHYFTDVLGGFLIGLAIVNLILWIFESNVKRNKSIKEKSKYL